MAIAIGPLLLILFQYPRADRLIVGASMQNAASRVQSLFQYPRADRLIVGASPRSWTMCWRAVSVSSCGSTYCWGQWQHPARWLPCSFSILVRIDLLLGVRNCAPKTGNGDVSVSSCGSTYCWGRRHADAQPEELAVSVSSCGSTYCWGLGPAGAGAGLVRFQYPRADRLIVGGPGCRSTRAGRRHVSVSSCGSTYCWGHLVVHRLRRQVHVSVSSCGSTYCWGAKRLLSCPGQAEFQYPRADRLIVGGRHQALPQPDIVVSVSSCGSTYCWGVKKSVDVGRRFEFQYPRADRLIVGAHVDHDHLDREPVSVSSCGSTYCWGSVSFPALTHAGCFSILVRIDLLLGLGAGATAGGAGLFQYPRADRLIVGGLPGYNPGNRARRVSVSSCGSTYCWGCTSAWNASGSSLFQYPRADRLIVGATAS